MKFKLLFAFTLLFSLGGSAFAFDVYLIKNGKLQAGVSYEQWEDDEGIPCGKLVEGDDYATLNHEGQYYDARLVIDQSFLMFNLKGKNLVVEYQMPSEAMMYDEEKGTANLAAKTAAAKEEPSLIVSASKGVGEDAKIEYTDKNNISFVNIDGKFNPNAEKGFVRYEGCAFAKSFDNVATVFVSFLRGNAYVDGGTPPIKIKNLYYADPELKPFYACAFDGKDTWTETLHVAVASEEPGAMAKHFDGLDFFQNNLGLTITGDDKRAYTADFKMLYQNGPNNWTGSDGSGFLSSELFHGLLVKSPSDFPDEFLEQDIVVSFEEIAMPVPVCIWNDIINVSCLICKDCRSDDLLGDPAAEYIPIFVKFDNDDTEYPLFTKSLINDQYTLESEDVVFPYGAKSVSVRFKANPTYSYIVDNLVLSTDYLVLCHGVDDNGGYATVNIYLDPTTNEVSFEGIDQLRSVELFSLEGRSVPCVVRGDRVDVSHLDAGEYAVVVNRSYAGKFLKK